MDKLNEIVATRTFAVLDEQGQPVEAVTVSLGRPEQEPNVSYWACPYQIDGLGHDCAYRGATGEDALQAMAGVLTVVGGVLAGEDEAKAGRLRWAGSSYFRSAFLRVHLAPEEGVPGELGPALATKTVDVVRDLYPRQGPMAITLGYPRQAPSGLWFCPYRVARLSLDSLWWVSGFDSMHALQSALFLIHGFEDYATELFQRHESWEGSHVLGFPVLPDGAEG